MQEKSSKPTQIFFFILFYIDININNIIIRYIKIVLFPHPGLLDLYIARDWRLHESRKSKFLSSGETARLDPLMDRKFGVTAATEKKSYKTCISIL